MLLASKQASNLDSKQASKQGTGLPVLREAPEKNSHGTRAALEKAVRVLLLCAKTGARARKGRNAR